MISIEETIIVEGRYDKIRLASVTDAPVISTDGFNIFKNEAKQKMIRKVAEKNGIIILTDSDRAGFLIRNFICSFVDGKYIKHAYIPQIDGKEKRKEEKSKDGFLGVEGVDSETLEKAIQQAAPTKTQNIKNGITKTDLYFLGLSGHTDSKTKREKLLKKLDLPIGMSSNAMVAVLNVLFTKEEIEHIITQII